MKKMKVFCYAGVCFMLIVFLASPARAGWDNMEVLEYNFDISATQRYEWYPYTDYNSMENEFMVVWRTSGMLRIDCGSGDDYECKNSFQSIHGQRVSPEGVLLGEPIFLECPFSYIRKGLSLCNRRSYWHCCRFLWCCKNKAENRYRIGQTKKGIYRQELPAGCRY